MNCKELTPKQQEALEIIRNFILYYSSDEYTRDMMDRVALDYVEQDHVLTEGEVA